MKIVAKENRSEINNIGLISWSDSFTIVNVAPQRRVINNNTNSEKYFGFTFN